MATAKKVSELTALTNAAATDLLLVVHDPASSAESRKITVANFFGNVSPNTTFKGSVSFANAGTAPANASYVGTKGEIRYSNDSIYFCIQTNTWKYAPLIDIGQTLNQIVDAATVNGNTALDLRQYALSASQTAYANALATAVSTSAATTAAAAANAYANAIAVSASYTTNAIASNFAVNRGFGYPAEAANRLMISVTSNTAFSVSGYANPNPVLYALSGTTIGFDLTNSPLHPFLVLDASNNQVSTLITHVAPNGSITTGLDAQGRTNGIVYLQLPASTVGTYHYQSSLDSGMYGNLIIKSITSLT